MNNQAAKQPPDPMAEIAGINSVLSTGQLDRPDALNLVTERARSLTGGNGAALGLEEGDTVLCCASTGHAPPLNATIRPDSGISGECLRTGKSLLCQDTNTDPRVDREACEALGIRATAVVPLCAGERTVGLLQVFDGKPETFSNDHLALLEMLGDIVVEFTNGSANGGSGSGSPPQKKPVQHEDRTNEAKPRRSWNAGSQERFHSERKTDSASSGMCLREELNRKKPPVPVNASDDRTVINNKELERNAPRQVSSFFVERGNKKQKRDDRLYISGMPRFGFDSVCALLIAFLMVFAVVRSWQPLVAAQLDKEKSQTRKAADSMSKPKPQAVTGLKRQAGKRVEFTTPVSLAGGVSSRTQHGDRSPKQVSFQLGAAPSTHMNVTDPLAAYEIQSLDGDSIEQLIGAAQSGDPVAELELGSAYELGRGVEQSCEMAARWIMRSARQGNAAAQYNLALRYAKSDGVDVDRQQSEKWLRKAIDQGYLARRASYAVTPAGD
jgi:GAF domain/Sel1 repeat